jgi:hypothetical protein
MQRWQKLCVLHTEGIEVGIFTHEERSAKRQEKAYRSDGKAYGAEQLIHASLLAQQKRLKNL